MPSAALVSARTRIAELNGEMRNDLIARRDAVATAREDGTDVAPPLANLNLSIGALRAISNAQAFARRIT